MLAVGGRYYSGGRGRVVEARTEDGQREARVELTHAHLALALLAGNRGLGVVSLHFLFLRFCFVLFFGWLFFVIFFFFL